MTYRLAEERVEVTPIVAWAVAFRASELAAAYYTATAGKPELAALEALYGHFLIEAQPQWDIVDHRGPVLPTTGGMLRLPVDLALGLVNEWVATITPKASAVDAVLPPGPLRDDLNAQLRAIRKRRKDAA